MSTLPDFSSAARGARPAARGQAWLIAGALALVSAAVVVAWEQADLEAARAELAQARASVAEKPKRRPNARRSQELLAQEQATAAAPPARVLAALQRLQPRGVRFERIGLRYGAELALDLGVVARGGADYDQLLAALEKSPAFADVTPGPENREGEVRSSLSLRYVGAGAR